jgi:hypothetical protein
MLEQIYVVLFEEMDRHIDNKIRDSLLDLIPAELGVTLAERELLRKEVHKKLTGVFWEAVDKNDTLRAHKDHFFSNGIVYSTSFDVYILGTFFSFCYAIYFVFTSRVEWAYVSGLCLVLAVLSRVVVTTNSRKRHLALSDEQLSLLRREQLDFVHARFRDIINGWRTMRH